MKHSLARTLVAQDRNVEHRKPARNWKTRAHSPNYMHIAYFQLIYHFILLLFFSRNAEHRKKTFDVSTHTEIERTILNRKKITIICNNNGQLLHAERVAISTYIA